MITEHAIFVSNMRKWEFLVSIPLPRHILLSSLPPSASRFGGITCMGFVCLCCCMTKIYERKERLWQRIGWITQSNELNESITRKWTKTRRERQLKENSDSFSSSFKQKWFWAYSHEYISSDGAAHIDYVDDEPTKLLLTTREKSEQT